MAENIKWLRLLRNQRKEHQIELSQVRLEYDALLLQERGRNDWLSNKLIETQRQLRLLTYEIERKEVVIDGLQADLRRKTQLRGSAPQTEAVAESVPSGSGNGSGDFSEHNITV